MKEKGVLLPVFSLPSKYGIGDFGYEAYEFIDILSENGIRYWNILPINACFGMPYSPISFYALNESYISLEKLKDQGLLKDLKPVKPTNRIKFGKYKKDYYMEAYNNFKKDDNFKKFCEQKEINEYADFARNRRKKDKKDKEYYLFLQYILYTQWMEVKNYANSKGVLIIGDMPMYPDFESCDVKYHSKYFEMKRGKFLFEAGAPPDYFNLEGQKWDSPVYNVANIKKDKYKYLVDRFKYNLKLFDRLRVDYFRGYDSFYRIPMGKSAREGNYVDGVSYGFFNELLKDGTVKSEQLIVEDLGDIRLETISLREKYNFTRQKIFQFSIDLPNVLDRDNQYENVLMFPGNHDCHTFYGWYKTLDSYEKQKLKEFLRNNHCNDINVNHGIMQYCLRCKAKIAIVTVQDILGLDDEARVNVPGTDTSDNWSWELLSFDGFRERIKDFNI